MQVTATMTRDLVMVAPPLPVETTEQTRQALGRAAKIAFLIVGIAATAWILGQFGTLLVYGLPAPLIRRVRVADAA